MLWKFNSSGQEVTRKWSSVCDTVGMYDTKLRIKQYGDSIALWINTTKAHIVHVHEYTIDMANDATGVTWTNMPSAITLWNGTAGKVINVDLTNFTQVRLHGVKLGTAGDTNSKLYIRYNGSFTTTASTYQTIGSSSVQVACNVQNSYLDSGWINLVAGAKGNVWVALLGDGGNGTIDPIFGNIYVSFR